MITPSSTPSLYTNWVCFNAPPQWVATADELKKWAIEHKYPVRIYFGEDGIRSVDYGETQMEDGYTADIWGSPYLVNRRDNIQEVKEMIIEHFVKFPKKADFKEWNKERTQKRNRMDFYTPLAKTLVFMLIAIIFMDIVAWLLS